MPVFPFTLGLQPLCLPAWLWGQASGVPAGCSQTDGCHGDLETEPRTGLSEGVPEASGWLAASHWPVSLRSCLRLIKLFIRLLPMIVHSRRLWLLGEPLRPARNTQGIWVELLGLLYQLGIGDSVPQPWLQMAACLYIVS